MPLPLVPPPGTSPRAVHTLLRTVVRGYHRAEAFGAEHVPAGGALVVSNHSGGALSMDVPIITTAIWDQAGSDRGVRVLAHDLIMNSPFGALLASAGFVAASPESAIAALREGAATIVFPGGEWEASRPWHLGATVDFNGRVGYVRTALAAGVPIVPVVSFGGQQTQVIVCRGEGLARLLARRTGLRAAAAPITLGFPFGLAVGVPQFPMPAKIVTRFLEPVDPVAEFGPEPGVAEVDELVRRRMQQALDQLAADRRLPVLG